MNEEIKEIGSNTYDYYLNNNISKLSHHVNREQNSSTITVKNPLSELHKNIVRERAKRTSQGGKPRPNFEKLEQIEAAKIFKDTIFLER